jgi:hypothetical protein
MRGNQLLEEVRESLPLLMRSLEIKTGANLTHNEWTSEEAHQYLSIIFV